MTLTTLRSASVLRALVAILAAIVVLSFPDFLGRLIFVLIGLAALAVGVIDVKNWWTSRRYFDLLIGLVMVLVGVSVLFGGSEIHLLLEYIVAGIIVIRSFALMLRARRAYKATGDDPFWAIASAVIGLTVVAALVLSPEAILHFVVVGIAVSWILGGVIVLLNDLGEDEDENTPYDVIGVIRQKSMPAGLRQQVSDAIFEGWDSRDGTLQFAALMSFATAIATFGVKADSTAVVIGAMLIAPLMSPIMALSASILMGLPKRALYSGRRVALGVVIGVGGSFLMALISPEFVPITANSQVLSRVSPTMLDMLIALAAGAAGGYAMTHPKVGNSLPGVAIAVALAPPLAVVGVSFQAGEFGFALGAFLLFLTNLVGIVVASGVTYILSGYSPWTRLERSGTQGRKSLVLVGLATVLVAFPLALIGDDILDQLTATTGAEEAVDDWLGEGTEFSLAQVQVSGESVEVVIVGPGDPPDPDDLAEEMAAALKRNVVVELRVIPETTHIATGQRPQSGRGAP
jgi:uncharacterized hydrophobic protein (TIGR00271 family)